MYKLVIVEDEDNIRHSLEMYFPWKELGFEVVQTFSDGFETVEYIRENSCDAVLTDIRMERMDGLEMVNELCKICPNVKVVILSGYSNFEFAQKAIRFRVVDYLLKPVDEEKLIEVFQNLKKQLDEEKKVNFAENDHREIKILLQQNLFKNLLKGPVVTQNELSVYLQFLEIEEKCIDYPLAAFQIKLAKDEENDSIADIDRMEVSNALHCFSFSEGAYQSFLYDEWDDKWSIAVICREQSTLKELQIYWKEKVQEFFQSLEPHMKGKLSYSLMKKADKMSHLLRQEDNRERHNKINWQVNEQNDLYQKLVLDYRLLVLELDLGSQVTVCHIIDNIIEGLRNVDIEQAKFVIKNLYSAIEAEYEKRKINLQKLTDGKFCFDKFIHDENFERIATRVREEFCDLCDKVEESKLQKDQGVVGRIIEYMSEHKSEELAHNFIAEKFKMHPGYLSRIFKETTGETFSGYYSRLKIESAANMLKDDHYKINEISSMVGFGNTSHFSFVFRKYTGYSPSEYRQRMILL